ncbi:hypothetical protein SX4_0057 [Vibrio mimicus SX-4]|nr:hypothetical protein SX4_0057 [Vibrio mimicus SX-4]
MQWIKAKKIMQIALSMLWLNRAVRSATFSVNIAFIWRNSTSIKK